MKPDNLTGFVHKSYLSGNGILVYQVWGEHVEYFIGYIWRPISEALNSVTLTLKIAIKSFCMTLSGDDAPIY